MIGVLGLAQELHHVWDELRETLPQYGCWCSPQVQREDACGDVMSRTNTSISIRERSQDVTWSFAVRRRHRHACFHVELWTNHHTRNLGMSSRSSFQSVCSSSTVRERRSCTSPGYRAVFFFELSGIPAARMDTTGTGA